MIRKLYFPFLILVILISACKSEFEKVRTSNDPDLIYEKANALYEEGDYNKAILLYELIIPAYRGRSEAETLNYKFAQAHYNNRSYILSSHYFKTFADTYTTSPRREEALYLYAMSEYQQSPKFKLDQTNSNKAIEAFQMFVNTYPNSDRVDNANQIMDQLRDKLEEKAFATCELYYNLKNYSSAIQSLENLLKDYPGSEQAEDALFLLAKASYEWANKSIYTRQEERYNLTMEKCDLFIKRYPESEYTDKVIDYKNNCLKAINSLTNG